MLCGQPEQKKRRARGRCPSCRRASPGTASAATTRAAISSEGPIVRRMRSPSAMAMSFGSSAALGRKQPVAALVLLADDQRLIRRAVERLLAPAPRSASASPRRRRSVSSPSAKSGDVLEVERPWAADLEQADAEPVRARLVDAEVVQRLAHVEIALADGDDAELRRCARRNR